MKILFFLLSSKRSKQLVFLNTNLQTIFKGEILLVANSKVLREQILFGSKFFSLKIGKKQFQMYKTL